MVKPNGVILESYSEKSFVLRGDTRTYKEDIKKLGGKWSPKLQDGAGWIFPKTKQDIVGKWINTGELEINGEYIQYQGTQKGTIEDQMRSLNTRVMSVERTVNKILERIELLMMSDNKSETGKTSRDIEEESHEQAPIRLLGNFG